MQKSAQNAKNFAEIRVVETHGPGIYHAGVNHGTALRQGNGLLTGGLRGSRGTARYEMNGIVTASVKPLIIRSVPRPPRIPLAASKSLFPSTSDAEASTTAICRNACE